MIKLADIWGRLIQLNGVDEMGRTLILRAAIYGFSLAW